MWVCFDCYALHRHRQPWHICIATVSGLRNRLSSFQVRSDTLIVIGTCTEFEPQRIFPGSCLHVYGVWRGPRVLGDYTCPGSIAHLLIRSTSFKLHPNTLAIPDLCAGFQQKWLCVVWCDETLYRIRQAKPKRLGRQPWHICIATVSHPRNRLPSFQVRSNTLIKCGICTEFQPHRMCYTL